MPQIIRRAGVAEDTHRLFGSPNFRTPARRIEIDQAELLVDVARGQPLRLQLYRIEDHADFAADPAVAVDMRHARHRQQFLGHRIVDVPAQFLDRHVGRDRGIACKVIAGSIGALDLRFQDAVGQIAADLLHRPAHVLDRAIDRCTDRELDHGGRLPFRNGRVDLIDPGQAAHRRLDLERDLIFEFGRRRTRLADRDDHDREIDVGIVVHLHPRKADDAGHGEHREQYERGNRVADRPCRDVAKAHAGTRGLTQVPTSP